MSTLLQGKSVIHRNPGFPCVVSIVLEMHAYCGKSFLANARKEIVKSEDGHLYPAVKLGRRHAVDLIRPIAFRPGQGGHLP